MKEEKGVTLISLIIYIMVMILIVALIANISSSFYSNLNEFDSESENAVAFSKFNMIFLNDLKKENIEILDVETDHIALKQDNQSIEYSAQNKALYRNKVKICDNVQDVNISADTTENIIKVYLKIGEYEKTTEYVIEKVENTNNTQII